MDFNVTAYEKKISDMVSNYIFQLNLRNEKTCWVLVSIKENVHYYLKTLLTYFPILKLPIWGYVFSSHNSANATHWDRLDAEAEMRNLLSSIKPDDKEIFKSLRKCHSLLTSFIFGKCSDFS